MAYRYFAVSSVNSIQLTSLGIAVSASGRMFSNYPPALDPKNQAYTVAELFANNTEQPYPSAEINTPPAGRINYTNYPPTGTSYTNYFIGVQSVVIDPADRLWILDTGRAATDNGTQVPAAYGGPKLIGIDLTTDQIFQTVVFDPTAAPADSVGTLTIAFHSHTDHYSISTMCASILLWVLLDSPTSPTRHPKAAMRLWSWIWARVRRGVISWAHHTSAQCKALCLPSGANPSTRTAPPACRSQM